MIAAANLALFAWLFARKPDWPRAGLTAAAFGFLVFSGGQSHLVQQEIIGGRVNTTNWYFGVGIAILLADLVLAITAMRISYQDRE